MSSPIVQIPGKTTSQPGKRKTVAFLIKDRVHVPVVWINDEGSLQTDADLVSSHDKIVPFLEDKTIRALYCEPTSMILVLLSELVRLREEVERLKDRIT